MITVVSYQQQKQGRILVGLDNGVEVLLYRSECASYKLSEGAQLTTEQYDSLLQEVVAKRAIKRAMHILEQMDRTEYQLRDKLKQGGYPEVCIQAAVDYVSRFHYLDDRRYACTYVRYHQEKMSRQQISQKLMARGVGREDIHFALEEEYSGDEAGQITELLRKKHFDPEMADEKEKSRIYAFLMRRGFRSSDVIRAIS